MMSSSKQILYGITANFSEKTCQEIVGTSKEKEQHIYHLLCGHFEIDLDWLVRENSREKICFTSFKHGDGYVFLKIVLARKSQKLKDKYKNWI